MVIEHQTESRGPGFDLQLGHRVVSLNKKLTPWTTAIVNTQETGAPSAIYPHRPRAIFPPLPAIPTHPSGFSDL